MAIRSIILASLLLVAGLRASAQVEQKVDSPTFRMQTMMWKIIQRAPEDFKLLKGSEVSRDAHAVFYKADLTRTVTDFEEMKAALHSQLFGAMLTTQDNIVETGGSTIYLAIYTDDSPLFSVSDLAKDAFTGLPAFLKMGNGIAKISEEPTGKEDKKKWLLTIKGVTLGSYTLNEKAGKGMLIFGIRK